MRFSKTRDSKRIFFILFGACLFMTIGAYAQSKSNSNNEKIPKENQGLKMVADVLDGFGGKSESVNFKMQMKSGGQPSAIGISQSDSFVVKAGYVHAAFILHGDADGDGVVDISDVVYLIHYLFVKGPEPIPMEAGDVNCNGVVNIADVIYLLNYVFIGGPPPCDP